MFDGLNRLKHDLTILTKRIRSKNEIVWVPSRGETDAYASVREIVHKRPLFNNTNRIMQRCYDATGADLNAFSFTRDRSCQDRGVRREAAKFIEVTFGDPHGTKAMSIRVLRSIHQ